MKNRICVTLPPLLLACFVFALPGVTHAQQSGQPRAMPAQKQTPGQKPGPSCDLDGRPVPDGATWCRAKSVHTCNASSGKWVNLGKKCP